MVCRRPDQCLLQAVTVPIGITRQGAVTCPVAPFVVAVCNGSFTSIAGVPLAATVGAASAHLRRSPPVRRIARAKALPILAANAPVRPLPALRDKSGTGGERRKPGVGATGKIRRPDAHEFRGGSSSRPMAGVQPAFASTSAGSSMALAPRCAGQAVGRTGALHALNHDKARRTTLVADCLQPTKVSPL